MTITQNKKIKISLKDYPYKKDIANRLFLATLSPFEINLLHELFYFGSKFNIADLADAVGCREEKLDLPLKIFSQSGLLVREDETIFVDKELKKYFESQIELFCDSFSVDFDYFQTLLKKVPISSLPVWYNLPKTSDTIFASIIEKYLYTPKLYKKHLEELVFDEPLCRKILDYVLESQTLEVPTAVVRKELNITEEKLHECLIILEFHIACALGFSFDGEKWQEVIVLFKEYRDFELHNKIHFPVPLRVPITEMKEPPYCVEPFAYFRKSLDALERHYGQAFGQIEKSVREIENACRSLPSEAWIGIDDFIRWMSFPIGMQEPVTLKRVGKKWGYPLPAYDDTHKDFIKQIITSLFFEMGITNCGITTDGALAFKITPFGKMTLGE